MVTDAEKEYYSDWISYIDDDGEIVSTYVKIIEVEPLIKFETLNKTIISLPQHRVNKIKQRGGVI